MHRCKMLFVATVLVLMAGCAAEQVKDINKRLVSLERVSKKPPNATYVVDPPDSIQIEFLDESELTRVVRLRSDGCVTLPYVGDVEVAGLTPKEIEEKLEERYEEFYKEPEVFVTVTDYQSKHIYVYGEVRRAGIQPYTGYQTLADAIGSAGGFTWRAAPSRVKVIRGDVQVPEIYEADLKELVYKGDTKQNVSLAEDDVVYVPPNALAWLGYQLDNLLWPFRGLFGVVYTARQATE